MHLSADDRIISISSKDVSVLIDGIHKVLENVNKWFAELVVNTKKSKYVLIKNKKTINLNQYIFCIGEKLERLYVMKYL